MPIPPKFNPHPPPTTITTDDTIQSSNSVDVESLASSTTTWDPKAHGSPPPLHFTFHWLRPSVYICFLIFFNVVVPCILYYILLEYTPIDEMELIGISSAALGASSCIDAPYRLYKLFKHREKYGPLNEPARWHLHKPDVFMWFYTIALFFMAVPLAVAPAIPLFDFFLFSLSMLITPMGVMLFISLHPWRFPCWLSSGPPGTPSRPLVYYILEDVVAVDFGYGRPWRREIIQRYQASPPFRDLMWWLTLYWAIMGGIVYPGISAAVIWTTNLHFAFGFVLGLAFIWAFFAGLGCYFLARLGLRREAKWWAANSQPHREREWSASVGSGTMMSEKERAAEVQVKERRKSSEQGF